MSADTVSPVWDDALRIGRVLFNRMSNALKLTAQGTHIRVTLSAVDYVHEPEVAPQATMEVCVVDAGFGIAPAELVAVFETFVQGSLTKTRAGGAGLSWTGPSPASSWTSRAEKLGGRRPTRPHRCFL